MLSITNSTAALLKCKVCAAFAIGQDKPVQDGGTPVDYSLGMKKIHIIDSHTGGEPTRLVIDGGPDLGSGPLSERRERFAREFDHFRSAVVCEPRGSDVLVGALLCEPHDPDCSVGVIFFNNVGYLGM